MVTTNIFPHTKPFFIPEEVPQIASPRGRLLIASCRSGTYLSRIIVERYRELLAEADSKGEVLYLEDIDFQFSDSETCVRLDAHVGGYDVFLVQSLFDPISERSVDQNYMAFLIAVRTLREHGARHVTAVLPYLAYSRQDKPTTFMREPTTAKLMADLSIEAGIDRLLTWDPHHSQVRGFYGNIPVAMLESITLFLEAFRRFQNRDDVITVAPDAGASKFVTLFGRALGLRSAIASKFRPRPEQAEITEIIGDFSGKRIAIVLDDMISSGGTMKALIEKLVEEKGIQEVYVGVSHNLCMEVARDRLAALHETHNLREVVITNSIEQTPSFEELSFVTVKSLSDTLSRTINRVHYNQSVSELFYKGDPKK
ncbi:MAG: ribose-phosphate pyrophosphokinase [Chloroflexi bacterium]|nr:ribose-phosphate pyrophosphokinase [Chloroflexota bacterium]